MPNRHHRAAQDRAGRIGGWQRDRLLDESLAPRPLAQQHHAAKRGDGGAGRGQSGGGLGLPASPGVLTDPHQPRQDGAGRRGPGQRGGLARSSSREAPGTPDQQAAERAIECRGVRESGRGLGGASEQAARRHLGRQGGEPPVQLGVLIVAARTSPPLVPSTSPDRVGRLQRTRDRQRNERGYRTRAERLGLSGSAWRQPPGTRGQEALDREPERRVQRPGRKPRAAGSARHRPRHHRPPQDGAGRAGRGQRSGLLGAAGRQAAWALNPQPDERQSQGRIEASGRKPDPAGRPLGQGSRSRSDRPVEWRLEGRGVRELGRYRCEAAGDEARRPRGRRDEPAERGPERWVEGPGRKPRPASRSLGGRPWRRQNRPVGRSVEDRWAWEAAGRLSPSAEQPPGRRLGREGGESSVQLRQRVDAARTSPPLVPSTAPDRIDRL